MEHGEEKPPRPKHYNPWREVLFEIALSYLFPVVAGVAIVAVVDFSALSRLWRGDTKAPALVECGAPPDVPRLHEHMKAWCGWRDEGGGYDAVGRIELREGRIKESVYFFEQAAKHRSASAYETLGVIYAQGRGDQVAPDMERAIASLEQSIRLGNRDAAEKLHLAYEGRLGVGQLQPRSAAMWAFGRCMFMGLDEQWALATVRNYGLTPAQVEEARAQMRDWIRRNEAVPKVLC